MIVCDLCERPENEHARDGLDTPNEHNWFWLPNACPVGKDTPFHPTQVFTVLDHVRETHPDFRGVQHGQIEGD